MEMKRVLLNLVLDFANNSILLLVLGMSRDAPPLCGGGGGARYVTSPLKKDSCGGNYPSTRTDINVKQPLHVMQAVWQQLR